MDFESINNARFQAEGQLSQESDEIIIKKAKIVFEKTANCSKNQRIDLEKLS
jgi:hypothetical protein